MTAKPRRRKSYPLALLNNKVNLDQLLAINNAMRYPLAYVQGPPGTGKTNTIVNTLTTAFFNDRTVLFPATTTIPLTALWKSCRPSPTTARPCRSRSCALATTRKPPGPAHHRPAV